MSNGNGQSMLRTDSAAKTPLSTFVGLYRTDLSFRGMADFAVVGALVMMFLAPPHKVAWPWSSAGSAGAGGGNASQAGGPGSAGSQAGSGGQPSQGASTAGGQAAPGQSGNAGLSGAGQSGAGNAGKGNAASGAGASGFTSGGTAVPPIVGGVPADALRERAENHLARKDYDSAIADLTEVIRDNSATWRDFNSRGRAYYRKGQLEAALADFDRAVSLASHDGSAHYNRALVHERLKRTDKAIEDLDAAINQHGDDSPAARLKRAQLRSERGEHAAALADHDKHVELVLADATAAAQTKAEVLLLRAWAKVAEIDAVRAQCRGQLQPSRRGPGVLDGGGVCGRPLGFGSALDDLKQALSIKPDLVRAQFDIARIHERAGQHDQAIEAYTATLRADRNYSSAYNNRGVLYSNSGQKELAFADFTEAIRADPRNAMAWANRAVVFANNRQRQRAIEDLRKALEIDPQLSFALETLRRLGARP